MARVKIFSSLMIVSLVTGITVAFGAADKNWSSYHGDAAGTHYSTLTQIDRKNVAKLREVWRYESPDAGPTQSTPLIVDGVMYVVNGNWTFAIDITTGRQIWRTASGHDNAALRVAGGGALLVAAFSPQALSRVDRPPTEARPAAPIAERERNTRRDTWDMVGSFWFLGTVAKPNMSRHFRFVYFLLRIRPTSRSTFRPWLQGVGAFETENPASSTGAWPAC